jgi:uncharacterized protein (TIGR02646 family)
VIAIVRTAQPAVLKKYAAQWLADLETVLADPTASPVERKRAIGRYKHPEVKTALVQLFHGKCAYCESKITAVTYGEIEHFHPKSRYPKHTFDWHNLMLSCNICNDKGHKGERFPLNDQGQPLLIDPTDGNTDISEHLEFVWDSAVGNAVVYGLDDRGRLVEDIFDLNGLRGRMELVRLRSQYVRCLAALCIFARDNNAEALALLREACSPEAEYSAFALSVCKALLGKLP